MRLRQDARFSRDAEFCVMTQGGECKGKVVYFYVLCNLLSKHFIVGVFLSCVTCLKSLLAPGCVIFDQTFLREDLDWIPGNSKHKPSAVPAVAVFCFLNFPSSEVQINLSENHAT